MNSMHGCVNQSGTAAARTVRIQAYVPLVLDLDEAVWVEAGDARIWATFDNDSADHLLEPGDGRQMPLGRAVLTAAEDTTVYVRALRPAVAAAELEQAVGNGRALPQAGAAPA
ncbi:MAG: DUF2917 domain-containing protein [Rhodocyclaceae bacterium]|nr:DUF2917 domain-containing protein [Rhodocyclaceae bacterium]MBX3667444.1 DUF2917 domain-containing protein [Rhodocyclaceae bacterium]